MALTAGSPAIAGDLETDFGQLASDAIAALTWADWTPTLGALTLGSGTMTARYVRIGTTVLYIFRFVYGSGSSVGTNPTFTLPVTPASHFVNASGHLPVGDARFLDAGTGRWEGGAYVLSGSIASLFYATEVGAGSGTVITSSAPMTWAVGDTIAVVGFYEAAA